MNLKIWWHLQAMAAEQAALRWNQNRILKKFTIPPPPIREKSCLQKLRDFSRNSSNVWQGMARLVIASNQESADNTNTLAQRVNSTRALLTAVFLLLLFRGEWRIRILLNQSWQIPVLWILRKGWLQKSLLRFIGRAWKCWLGAAPKR